MVLDIPPSLFTHFKSPDILLAYSLFFPFSCVFIRFEAIEKASTNIYCRLIMIDTVRKSPFLNNDCILTCLKTFFETADVFAWFCSEVSIICCGAVFLL